MIDLTKIAFITALTDLVYGQATVEMIEEEIKHEESLEEYEVCAGLQKAIKIFKQNNL